MTKKEDMPQESLYAFPTMVGKDWGRGSMFTTPLDRGTRFPLTMTAQPIFSPATSEKKEEGTQAKGSNPSHDDPPSFNTEDGEYESQRDDQSSKKLKEKIPEPPSVPKIEAPTERERLKRVREAALSQTTIAAIVKMLSGYKLMLGTTGLGSNQTKILLNIKDGLATSWFEWLHPGLKMIKTQSWK